MLPSDARRIHRTDTAKYGEMTLYEADIDLEMAKLFFCEYRYPGRDSGPVAVCLQKAKECLTRARQRLELGYKKRLPELTAFAREMDTAAVKS
jgi:hypothetical protein